MSALVVQKIADHFARQGEGEAFMGWVIRDPRIIWWGGGGGVGPPRISDSRTAYHTKYVSSTDVDGCGLGTRRFQHTRGNFVGC